MKKKVYSYKICYKEKGSNELKRYLVTNSLEGAKWDVNWFNTHPPNDRKDNHTLINPTWYIIPVTKYREHKMLWRGCPF